MQQKFHYTNENLEEIVLSQMIISKLWKLYKLKREIQQMDSEQQFPIQIYFSDICPNQKQRTDNDRLFQLLKDKKIPYYKHDLTDNLYKQDKIKKDRQFYDTLPMIYINGIFIGGYDDFQKLCDSDYLQCIINKEYLKQCVICKKQKDPKSQICAKCGINYKYFQISE
ncbi:hypothetical protein pb186bvf_011157 [Paramecium bursaria]